MNAEDNRYGYNDPLIVTRTKWTGRKWLSLIAAILIILALWFALDRKLLLGDDWFSKTYDNEEWRTNEGNLRTNGAWDFETHVWKTIYALKYFPNVHWNPYWYLGMPLFKYYQNAFYVLHALTIIFTGLSAAKAALYLVIFGHLAAVLLTFVLCYKLSGKIWAALFASLFLLESIFISLRSYGWEPISVVFLALYPLGLLIFFKAPLRPFRFWLIFILGLSYIFHPLIFFSLAMSYGLYLFSIAIRRKEMRPGSKNPHAIWAYFGVIILSLLIGAVQFFPQMSYAQKSSGAHMGVSYIPFYHVEFNVISPVQFFLNAGNLKGPGLIIMVTVLMLLVFSLMKEKIKFRDHEMIAGLIFILAMMVIFYYLEIYNIFPMNILRSIQYHRIIPEFIITAAALIAVLSNILNTKVKRVLYYSILIIFCIASSVLIYNIQEHWQTERSITYNPEFIKDRIEGRITFPYTDQSLSVRSSFGEIHQVYGYYEQGITNTYADELFSVSSGFHPVDISMLYLKAANVERLYINTEEGRTDRNTKELFETRINFTHIEGERYGYFEIPLQTYSFAQAVDGTKAREVKAFQPGCRTIFKENYCESEREEFVTLDTEEQEYLTHYVDLIETPYTSIATMEMVDPQHYKIRVENAQRSTDVIVKMTYDEDFVAIVDNEEVTIEKIGPDFMLLSPDREGSYTIMLEYKVSKIVTVGAIVSIITLLGVMVYFIIRLKERKVRFRFKRGELQ